MFADTQKGGGNKFYLTFNNPDTWPCYDPFVNSLLDTTTRKGSSFPFILECFEGNT